MDAVPIMSQFESRRDLDPASIAVLARVAHEMRQPLAAAAAAVALIRDDVDAERRKRACRVLTHQCARLLRLLDDLLVTATVGSDVTTLNRERVDLSRLLFDMTEALRPLAAQKDQDLDFRLPAQPCWIDADPVRLDQVFSNILTNSMKYTDPGGRISITEGLIENHAVVTIGDTGQGIPPDLLPHVFEMFVTSSGRARSGLGLGLAVARHLVDLHGGSIAVASEGYGRGTEVRVTLPLLKQRH
jgi:signal transduction histidine kinase